MGRSGLRVSELALGAMTFGNDEQKKRFLPEIARGKFARPEPRGQCAQGLVEEPIHARHGTRTRYNGLRRAFPG